MDNGARARLAATALVEAAGTDGWDAVRPKIAGWFGQGRSMRKVERQLAATRKWMLIATARGASQDIQAAREVAQVRAAESREWAERFANVLAARPDAAGELDHLTMAIRAVLPDPAPGDGAEGLAGR